MKPIWVDQRTRQSFYYYALHPLHTEIPIHGVHHKTQNLNEKNVEKRFKDMKIWLIYLVSCICDSPPFSQDHSKVEQGGSGIN